MTSARKSYYPQPPYQFHNPEKGTYLGRTPSSWGKIGLFYLIFYGVLAALVAICMWIFFQTLDPRIPKWKLDSSIIGDSPGMGFRPMPENNLESTLIWLKGSNETNWRKWVSNLSIFLDKYYYSGKTEKGNVPLKRCSHRELPMRGQTCDIDVRIWEQCNIKNFFNFHKNSPCIFIKLNKIYGWIPEYYNDPNYLPDDMPGQLKEHIRNITTIEERDNVWVSCQGENPADIEHLGPIEYYPKYQGFPGYYYPFLNSEGYLSPLVAVRFLRPTSGIVINVECRAWARNIKYNRLERGGAVHFELLID